MDAILDFLASFDKAGGAFMDSITGRNICYAWVLALIVQVLMRRAGIRDKPRLFVVGFFTMMTTLVSLTLLAKQ